MSSSESLGASPNSLLTVTKRSGSPSPPQQDEQRDHAPLLGNGRPRPFRGVPARAPPLAQGGRPRNAEASRASTSSLQRLARPPDITSGSLGPAGPAPSAEAPAVLPVSEASSSASLPVVPRVPRVFPERRRFPQRVSSEARARSPSHASLRLAGRRGPGLLRASRPRSSVEAAALPE